VSAGISAGGYALSALVLEKPWQRALAGAGLALSAGVAKELWDLSGHGDPSWKDLAWDGIGTGVGVGLALGVDLLLFRQRERAMPSQAALLIRF
jgi:putative lipoprotein